MSVATTYLLQLLGPAEVVDDADPKDWAIQPSLLREVEENLSDLLPKGWSVKIYEWDSEEEADG